MVNTPNENMADVAQARLGEWLEGLASSAPAPGGGAAAAVNVAVGAALIEMVCNLTIGKPRYAEHEATMKSALDQAGQVRQQSLALAAEDEQAFSAVSDAYRLPKDSDEEKATRSAAIQEALVGAADVPLRTAEAAARVVDLAGEILDGANVNVLSDVAVAAASARAGFDSAVINVEINLASMRPGPLRDEAAGRLASHEKVPDEAARIVAEVRQRIAG